MRSLIKIAGISVQGRAHEKAGTTCQDKHFVWRGKDKKSAGIALADGAGSSPYSQIGAEYAVNAVIPFVKERFDDYRRDLTASGVATAEFLAKGLDVTAKSNGLKFRDMACTLLFVVIRRKKKSIHYVAGHIGDGVILCQRNAGVVDILSAPERGEFANETVFLTSRDAKSRLRIYCGTLKRPAGFIVMSDGTADTLYIRRSRTANQVYSKQILDWCNRYPQRQISKALDMNLREGVFREVSSDDCSLCMLKVT